MNQRKRDYVNEIRSIKSRSEFNSRYDYGARLYAIESALNEFTDYNGDFNNELLKYIPISTVACFEAFFRSAIKEIIDFGKPFSDNVANYNQAKNIKLDFEIVSAIQIKTLTVGELVAHLLPYNNYDDISSNLSILLDKDFTKELKNFRRISVSEDINKLSEDFQNRFAEIISSVKRTYELRHIFSHEFATNVIIDKNEILENYNNCRIFLEQTNNLIWEILYPNSPETQTGLELQASEKLEIKEAELDKLIAVIKEFSKDDEINYFEESIFNQCMEKWYDYRKLHAEYKASFVKGGSMYNAFYLSDLERVTIEKIKSLSEEFEIILRKNNYT